MTLRTRLTAAFLAVVLGPVLLGAVFVGGTVAMVSRDRASHRLDLAASAVTSAIGGLCRQLRMTAAAVAAHPPDEQPEVATELTGGDLVGAVRVVDAAGDPLVVTRGAPPQPWLDCAGPVPGAVTRYGAIAARAAPPAGSPGGAVWAAARLDQPFVERLAAAAGAAVTLLDGDPAAAAAGPVYSTDEAAESAVAATRSLAPGEMSASADDRWVRLLEPAAGQPLPLVLTVPRTRLEGLYGLLTGVVVLTGLLAVVAAWRLARSTTRPLAELARAADRMAGGDLTPRVPVRSGDEAGRLAAAFNRMAHQTHSYVQALTASRDQLRRHLAVLGDTLSSTHDLDRILRVILQTALAATGARSGAVVLLDQETAVLTGHAASAGGGTGPDASEEVPDTVRITVPLGRGLLGSVAATGRARRGRVIPDAPTGPALDESEPRCDTFVAVPISAPGGLAAHTAPWPAPPTVRGVLALYDRLTGDEFDDRDLVTLRTFAGQAAVAVDNVRTHEEAQRLSLTDPLTGLWNYRHLQESMRREVERHSRFGHTLAVLTLDLDRFKDVNDAYGHPAGDEVLIEFARRIRAEIRDIDQAFRQGGEEFVVLLPQTDAPGGAVLAQRLGAALRGTPVMISPRGAVEPIPIDVTVSIGIAVYPDHALVPQAVLDAADDALYAAKAAGRDTYRVAPDPVLAEDLPVPPAARSPDDDLPHAGGEAADDRSGGGSGTRGVSGTAGGASGTAGGASGTGGGATPTSGGAAGAGGPGEAKPPRQTRGR